MKLSGWIFMIISWSFITGMAIFCFSRIFKKGLGGEDPVYVLLGAVAFFFIYIIVKGNLQDRKNKKIQKKEQNQNE